MVTRKKRGKYYKFCIFEDDYHVVPFDNYHVVPFDNFWIYKYCIQGYDVDGISRDLYLGDFNEIIDFKDKRRKPGTWCKVEGTIFLALEHYSNLFAYA